MLPVVTIAQHASKPSAQATGATDQEGYLVSTIPRVQICGSFLQCGCQTLRIPATPRDSFHPTFLLEAHSIVEATQSTLRRIVRLQFPLVCAGQKALLQTLLSKYVPPWLHGTLGALYVTLGADARLFALTLSGASGRSILLGFNPVPILLAEVSCWSDLTSTDELAVSPLTYARSSGIRVEALSFMPLILRNCCVCTCSQCFICLPTKIPLRYKESLHFVTRIAG